MICDYHEAARLKGREQLTVHLGTIDVHVRRVVVKEQKCNKIEIVHARRHRIVEGSNVRHNVFIAGVFNRASNVVLGFSGDRLDSGRRRCRLAQRPAQTTRCYSRPRLPYRAPSYRGAHLRRPEADPFPAERHCYEFSASAPQIIGFSRQKAGSLVRRRHFPAASHALNAGPWSAERAWDDL